MRPGRPLRPVALLASVALLCSLGIGVVDAAPQPESATISRQATMITWQGSHFTNASVFGPQFCSEDTCDTFHLEISLGDRYWKGRPDAVQVGVQWKRPDQPESESEYDDYDLYV